MTIEDYLKSLKPFIDDAYGRQIRQQFQTIDGKSELAMLSSPTQDEYNQLARSVAIMTSTEKQQAHQLTDEQIEKIADDANTDKALVAIFFNGYAIKTQK